MYAIMQLVISYIVKVTKIKIVFCNTIRVYISDVMLFNTCNICVITIHTCKVGRDIAILVITLIAT